MKKKLLTTLAVLILLILMLPIQAEAVITCPVYFDLELNDPDTTEVCFVPKGGLVPKPEDPYRRGWMLKYWAKKENWTYIPWNFETDRIDGDTAIDGTWIYAVWDYIRTDRKPLDYLELVKGPARTHYRNGDTLDPTGMVVRAHYVDGTIADVSDHCKLPDVYSTSQNQIKVSYRENDVIKELLIPGITVEEYTPIQVKFYGSVTSSKPTEIQTVHKGTPLTRPADPVRENYRFDGWEDGNHVLWDFSTPVTEYYMELRPRWTRISNTVRFETGLSDVTIPSQTVPVGSPVTEPEPLHGTGVFMGWYTSDYNPTPEEKWDFARDIPEWDLTLYAVWDRSITLSFDLNGGTSKSGEPIAVEWEIGYPLQLPMAEGMATMVVFPENCYLAGYEINGRQYAPGETVSLEADTVIGLLWGQGAPPPETADTRTVTIDLNGGTKVREEWPLVEVHEVGSRYTLGSPEKCMQDVIPPEGQRLWGYEIIAGGRKIRAKPGNRYTLKENITIRLLWNNTFTVHFDLQGHGEAIPDQSIARGGRAEEPWGIRSWDGDFYFEGWYTDPACTPGNEWNFSCNPIQNDVTLYARWVETVSMQILPVKIMIDKELTGGYIDSISHVPKGGVYRFPSPSEIYVDTNADRPRGYTFSHFVYNGQSYGPNDTVTLTEDSTCHLLWKKLGGESEGPYHVTFSHGSMGGTDFVLEVPPNTPVPQPESPEPIEGYVFAGWCAAPPEAQKPMWNFDFPVNSDMTLYAVWKKLYPYTMDFSGAAPTLTISVNLSERIELSPERLINYLEFLELYPAGRDLIAYEVDGQRFEDIYPLCFPVHEGMVVKYIWSAPTAPFAAIGEASSEGLTVTLERYLTAGIILAAGYDDQGKMVAVGVHPVQAADGGEDILISGRGFDRAASWKVFWTDETFHPLLKAVSKPEIPEQLPNS